MNAAAPLTRGFLPASPSGQDPLSGHARWLQAARGAFFAGYAYIIFQKIMPRFWQVHKSPSLSGPDSHLM